MDTLTKRSLFSLVSFLLLTVFASGQAEIKTVYLKDGTTIQGKIVAQDDSTLVLETQYGTLEIRRTSILREELAKQLPAKPKPKEAQTVYLKDGTTVKGVITFESADSLTVETGYGSMKIPRSSVIRIGSKLSPKSERPSPVEPERNAPVLHTPVGEKKTCLYFSGGLSFPSKPKEFTDYWNMGFNVGGGFGFDLTPSLSILGLAEYNNLSFNKDQFLRDFGFSSYGISLSGGAASILTVTGSLKILLNPSTSESRVYVLGGIGFFQVSTSDVQVSYQGRTETAQGTKESAFSAHFGAGVDIPVGAETYIFLQGSYGMGFTKDEGTNYIPLKLGVRMKI
jgi:opacity protein-like surface antigen